MIPILPMCSWNEMTSLAHNPRAWITPRHRKTRPWNGCSPGGKSWPKGRKASSSACTICKQHATQLWNAQSLILDNCSRVACHEISFVLLASCWSSRWFFYPRWAPLDQISSEDLRRRNCADARSCRKSNSFITTKCLSWRWHSQIPPRCLVHCIKCDLHLNILYYTIQRICSNSTSIYIIFIWRI